MSASAAQKVDPAHATLWARRYPGHDMIGTRTFGFWLYMLTDAMVYAALFATLGVLSHVVNLAGGGHRLLRSLTRSTHMVKPLLCFSVC